MRSHGQSILIARGANYTGVATLLDALSPVRDASGRVSWVDDVALVACRTVKRLVSVLSCAAGLSWWAENILCIRRNHKDEIHTRVILWLVHFFGCFALLSSLNLSCLRLHFPLRIPACQLCKP